MDTHTQKSKNILRLLFWKSQKPNGEEAVIFLDVLKKLEFYAFNFKRHKQWLI